MANTLRQLVGWATPVLPAFDTATLVRRLGHMETDTCLANKQGRCPGKFHCADCHWSEGPFREPR